jgi:hypothetical protein
LEREESIPISAQRPAPQCAPKAVASRQRRSAMRLSFPKPARCTVAKAKELPFSLSPTGKPSFPASQILEPTGGVIPPGGGPLAKATLARRRHQGTPPGTCTHPTSDRFLSLVANANQAAFASFESHSASEISRRREMNQPRIESIIFRCREAPPSQRQG